MLRKNINQPQKKHDNEIYRYQKNLILNGVRQRERFTLLFVFSNKSYIRKYITDIYIRYYVSDVTKNTLSRVYVSVLNPDFIKIKTYFIILHLIIKLTNA